jgi:hypothetical protein
MPNHDPSHYTFQGLLNRTDGPLGDPGPISSLCYLISLTDSPAHPISEYILAKRILAWLYDCEQQSLNADHLKENERFFERYFSGGFYPKTPVMVVRQWSPISVMLQNDFAPLTLGREAKGRSVASGIWAPPTVTESVEIEDARTDEQLFWAIMKQVSALAEEEQKSISIVAQPGWYYASAIGSLPSWSAEEVGKSGRVLWKRTPDG